MLDAAQEVLEALNEEADKLIRQVWDCIEAFFGSESHASKRSNSREFGVVYVRDSESFILSGILMRDGAAVEGVPVTLVDSGAASTSNHEGRYSIRTILTGEVTLRVDVQGIPPVLLQVTIGEETDVNSMEVPVIEI